MSEGKVRVQPLRPFEGEEGWKDETSEPFEVSRGRFAELKASGLVEEVKVAKAAPEPLNKMAPDATNKAETGRNRD